MSIMLCYQLNSKRKMKTVFDEINAIMLQFKQKIHGWIRNVER